MQNMRYRESILLFFFWIIIMKSHLLYSWKQERKITKITLKMYLQNEHIPWKSIENYCSFRPYFIFSIFSLKIAIKMCSKKWDSYCTQQQQQQSVACVEYSRSRKFQCAVDFFFCSVRNRGRYFVKFNKFEWLDEISVISSDVRNRIFIMNIAISNTRRFEWIQLFREKNVFWKYFSAVFQHKRGIFFWQRSQYKKKIMADFVNSTEKNEKKQSPALLHNLVKKFK